MRRPLLLPVPRTLLMERGCFLITEATCIALMPGCEDAEMEAARDLAAAIECYAEGRVLILRSSTERIPLDGIGLRLAPRGVRGCESLSPPTEPPPPSEPTEASEQPDPSDQSGASDLSEGSEKSELSESSEPRESPAEPEFEEPCDLAPSEEGYRLRIDPTRIDLEAETSAGLFYGVQTLIQIVRQYGHRLPALCIQDEPDFRWRGFMLDVSRGRVPKLDYLKWLVHTLSHFKINMLHLYIEHTFHFASHPEIGAGCSPLEPEEILELDRYCRSRHVELVPCLQSFGHMGFTLSLPGFRHLAEILQFDDWSRASWRQRLRGMTITPADEGTYRLLSEMYSDFLPLFQSRLFNLNSDETWDLGKGRSNDLAREMGVGRLYLRHIERIAALARRHERVPMIWSDIVHQHPELLAEAPEDLILLDWAYEHDAPVDRCVHLAEAGRPFFICPGTSGWNQVFPDVWNATINIRRAAAAGRTYGALGVLNTDWGDCGHFNLPAGSLHGAVLGAAMAWNEGRPESDLVFDQAFSLHAFDDCKGVLGAAIRQAGSLVRRKTGKRIYTWELWAAPWNECRPGREIPPKPAQAMGHELADLAQALALCPREVRCRDPHSWSEICLGVAMLDSLVMRAEADHRRLGHNDAPRSERISLRMMAERDAILAEWVEKQWRLRSKRSNLDDILSVFDRQIRDVREATGAGE